MKPTWNNFLKIAYPTSRDKSLGQRIEVLTEYFGKDRAIINITSEVLLDLVKVLRDKGLSGSTINRYLSIVSKVASVYRKTNNPLFALYIPWQPEGAGRFEWLRQTDEEAMMAHLKAKGQDDLALVIRVLLVTGMRLGELLSLEPNQIEDDWIRLWKTKTNRPRSVPLPEGLGATLRALVERGLPKGHTIRRGLRDALRACGVMDNITPHSLRHTTATRLVKGGVNLLVAGRYLGHNSLKTTQRYVHIEDEDIRKAMTKL
jgi:integrase